MLRFPLCMLSLLVLVGCFVAMPVRAFAQDLSVPMTNFPGIPLRPIPDQPEPPPFPPTPPPFVPTPPEGLAESGPSFVDQGESDFKAANYTAAMRDWQHALIESPDNGAVLLLLGQAMFALGRFEDEFLLTQRAMQKLPAAQWGEVVRNYGELYRDNKEYTDQLRVLEKLRKSHDAPQLRFLLGYHYGYLGYPREAVRELDKALAAAPQDQLAKKLRDQFAGAAKSSSTPAK